MLYMFVSETDGICVIIQLVCLLLILINAANQIAFHKLIPIYALVGSEWGAQKGPLSIASEARKVDVFLVLGFLKDIIESLLV